MNTLVGIVLYNPEIDLLRQNIEAICKQDCGALPHIHIIDNGSDNIKDIENLLNKYENVSSEFNGNNVGIAKALNQIMAYAKNREYDWVLSLDQDSIIPNNMLREYELFLTSSEHKNIAIISPRIADRNLKNDKDKDKVTALEIDKCITSGSFIKTLIWDQVGHYNEWMFIDFVDFDICARVRIAGYKIYRLEKVVISHTIGESVEHKIFGRKIISTNHSPIRHYYYSRNLIYFSRKYGKFYKKYNFKKMWFIEFLSALLFEKNKWSNILMMIKGLKDSHKEGR